MQIYYNGKVIHYKDAFPNTSFPASGPSDAFLAERGAVKVNVFREHDKTTQKLVQCSPVVENGWAYIVEVVNKTDEEIAADTTSKAAQIRAERDRKLSETDWRFRSDMNPSQDWIEYCQALRDIPEQEGFPWNVEWPTDPNSSE